MSTPATIDHSEVHVDMASKHKQNGPAVVTRQPGYHQDPNAIHYDSETAMAVFTQSPAPIVAQRMDPKLKPKDFVITSCFVVFACNFIFGLLGYHFGVKSNYAWQLGDIDQARRQARRALSMVIIGITVGVTTYVLAFVFFFVVFKSEHDVENRGV